MAPPAPAVCLEMGVPLQRGKTNLIPTAEGSRGSISGAERPANTRRRASVSKSWTASYMEDDTQHLVDARNAGIDPEVALATVRWVTRVASTGSFILFAVTLITYILTGQNPVIKTLMLEAFGDLMANLTTLYAGIRMSRLEPLRFPAGQARFEPIGVLAFSAMMATLMFSNAMANFENLITPAEQSREAAINSFLLAMFGDQGAGWEAMKLQVLNPKAENMTEVFSALAGATSFSAGVKAIENDIGRVAQVVTAEQEYQDMMYAFIFFGIAAVYQVSFFLYIKLFALPRTNSSILTALSIDLRNGFIGVALTAISMFCVHFFGDKLGSFEDSMDELVSLVFSLAITKTWCELLAEQVVVLAPTVAEDSVMEPLKEDVRDSLLGTGLEAVDMKAYSESNAKHVVEVTLGILDPHMHFIKVDQAMSKLQLRLSTIPEVERVIVIPRLVDAC